MKKKVNELKESTDTEIHYKYKWAHIFQIVVSEHYDVATKKTQCIWIDLILAVPK